MDRFKFRIWDIKQQKYRQRTHHEADTCLDCLSGKVLYGEGIEIYGEEDDKDVVLEQCTGLKDKNGKLIYEGDIVYSNLDGGTQKVIYWDDGLASFMAYNRYPDKHYTQRIGDGYFIELGFEVIGNIHENADLLGEE